jgi:signal transduction histidine kinase
MRRHPANRDRAPSAEDRPDQRVSDARAERPPAALAVRTAALILVASPVTAIAIVAGLGLGFAAVACVPIAVALGVGAGVLFAARIAAPEPWVQPVSHSFGVRALLTRAAHEVGPTLPEVDVLVDVAPRRLRTFGDPECLHRAVAELIERAARRSPPGGVVTLAGRSAAAGVRLEILDEGGGDCAEGLLLAPGIVDSHGGALRTEHARPRGCRVVVELPGV